MNTFGIAIILAATGAAGREFSRFVHEVVTTIERDYETSKP